ncbi:hypothetical protein CSPX01_16459 [Colletotrichum filicis]|nr:hypothetical protein CSPX01_16459 [Colletotrichum filicis]
MPRYPSSLSNALESQSMRCEFGRNLADNVKEGYLRIETRLAEYGKHQMPSTMLLHGYWEEDTISEPQATGHSSPANRLRHTVTSESHTGRSGTKKRTSHGPGQRRATLDTRAHSSACVEADLLDGVENSHRHDIRSKRYVPESRHRQVDGLEKQSMGQIP